MKKALSCKIVLLFIAFALSIALAFSFYGVRTVSAADITQNNIGNYFGGTYQSLELSEGNLVAKVEDGGNVSIKQELVIDDLAIELNVPADVSSFKITLTYASYFVNGVYNDETEEFDKSINNEFTFTATGDLKIEISTENNVVSVKIDEETQTKDGIYYKIKGIDKCVATIAFDFTLEEAEDAEITFKSIDQKQSDISGAYKQTFALDEETSTKIATFAKPRVSVNSLTYIKYADGNFKVVYGIKETFTFTAYSVFSNVSSSSVYIDKDTAGYGLNNKDSAASPKYIVFENTDEVSFSVRTTDIADIEEYTVSPALLLENYEDDNYNQAPYYIEYAGNEAVYNNYALAVQKAATKDYGDEYGVHSIRLGDSYEIPSLQDLVADDYDNYSALSYTVYYRTPSTATSTTSLKFTVSEAGDYEFYVVFKDKAGKTMEKDDFYTLDDDNQTITEGEYIKAVFKFTVHDDAPISVEAPVSQGAGYLNTRYTASAFKIQSSGNNVKYALYYNAKANAAKDDAGWVEIPLLTDISEDYDENGFTYEDIKTINYDGTYTFTPVKKGAYKIECNVMSVNQERSASDYTIIKVSEEPTVVKVDDKWFQKNVWSIVFLSIGTLSLIGIIVLLFIKPKEEIEKDETGDALNVNAKK
ncbi:MAG: hypothetical protein IJQ87_04620 [Clostridia bacterium]|nr:hypothetical protein [Clostridia bacterium]